MRTKYKYRLWTTFWLMGTAVAQSQSFSECFRENKIHQHYLDQQIEVLKFYSYVSQKGYDTIQKGLLIFAALEEEGFELHQSHLHTRGELHSSLYTRDHLNKMQLEYDMLIQFTSDKIKTFKTSNSRSQQSLSGLRWQLWRLMINGKQQLQILDNLIDSNYFKMEDAQRIQRIEVQKVLIQKQHNQLKSLYVQFIMLSLNIISN